VGRGVQEGASLRPLDLEVLANALGQFGILANVDRENPFTFEREGACVVACHPPKHCFLGLCHLSLHLLMILMYTSCTAMSTTILTNMCIESTWNIMHLSKYMKRQGLKDEEVAEKIGVSRVTISRIRRRKVRPDWETIKQLRKFSEGKITAADFESLAID
jgi:DNA-binding XRE family transcriptional regulator